MNTDQFFLICCSYDQYFNKRKVDVVKALRTMFRMSLKDAKDMADNYICLETTCGQTHRDITFRCNELQTAWAMCMLSVGDVGLWAKARHPDNPDVVDQRQIFMFRWIEPASDSGVIPVMQYEVK